MNHFIGDRWSPILVLLFSLVSGAAFSDDYDDGLAAYNSKDYEAAARHWSSPAMKNDARALYGMGKLYMKGLGVGRDYKKGTGYYRRSADLGYSSAQFNLGLAYFKGNGVERDIAQTVHWWRRAGELGHGSAQFNLGTLLWKGEIVPRDDIEAMKWIKLAFTNENRQARRFVDTLYQPMSDSMVIIEEPVQVRAVIPEVDTTIESDTAVVDKQDLYSLGQQALDQEDFEQAMALWFPLANSGHLDAQYKLGLLFESGQGNKKNMDKALEWYERAAKAGQSDAQFRIGLYHMNEAKEINKTLGLYWIQSAADNNHPEAQEFLNSGG